HPEVEGTSGQVKQEVLLVQSAKDVDGLLVNDPDKLSYVTQTTLSVDDTRSIIEALKNRFPNIEGPDLRDICYATQNRQDAVRHLAKVVDIVLVIGSANSSNSNRLRDLAEEIGVEAHLIDGANDICVDWFKGQECTVGITAGASAPEILLERVLDRLSQFAEIKLSTMDGVSENVKFKIPSELEEAA
ncbi:UNVERIFIED_CONTAM: hypothetical protein GTU68_023422, partial [Idotea baltica]|nr:hypothetical protein [Idotea baltica]